MTRTGYGAGTFATALMGVMLAVSACTVQAPDELAWRRLEVLPLCEIKTGAGPMLPCQHSEDSDGGCTTIFDDAGTPCDDGDPCTGSGNCDTLGHCMISGTPADCDAGCLTCDGFGSCMQRPETAPCSDPGSCISNGACVMGHCAGGTTACDVQNECQLNPRCQSGSCAFDIRDGGTCDAGPCSNGTCDPFGNCVQSPRCQGTQCASGICLADAGCGTTPVGRGLFCTATGGLPGSCDGQGECIAFEPDSGVVDSGTGTVDAGTDGGADAGADAGEDAGEDAGADAGEDAGTDDGGPGVDGGDEEPYVNPFGCGCSQGSGTLALWALGLAAGLRLLRPRGARVARQAVEVHRGDAARRRDVRH